MKSSKRYDCVITYQIGLNEIVLAEGVCQKKCRVFAGGAIGFGTKEVRKRCWISLSDFR